MKTKQNIFVSLIVMALFLPFIGKAQGNLSWKETTPKQEKKGWQPVVLDGNNNNNVKNGVEIYAQKGDCPFGIIKLVKLVNTNNYPVRLSYQISQKDQLISVLVPAATTIEGSCADTEGNLAKLVIRMPEESEDAQKKTKEYILSHIEVSKVQ